MDCNYQIPSLLPYLRGTGEIKLDFSSVISEDAPVFSGHRSSARISGSDSMALRYGSRLLSQAGSLFKNVTLLIQRDDYPALQLQSRISNIAIEQCWQLALKSRLPSDVFGDTFLLKNQIDEAGRLLPFAPLFYCGKKEQYFHPPCSRCGKMLQLCTDDNLLGEFGLPYYSKSFHRYLYCPTCTPLHGKPWYVKSLKGEDVGIVSDFCGLFESFGTIKEMVDPQLCFPCGSCVLQGECFGLAGSVVEALTIISFYPFYMLVVAESDFDGADYLSLVAGASQDDIKREKASRMAGAHPAKEHERRSFPDNGFFFSESDPHHFLEILYLKLLFLKQAVELFQQGSLAHHQSGCYLSPREIGVSVLARSTLPSFWSFSLSLQAVDRFIDEIVVSPSSMQGNRMFHFGLLWFAVLLTNRQTEESTIFSVLQELLEEPADENRILLEASDLFLSRNIYWNPVAKPDDVKWSDQWGKVLNIGWDLLVTGSGKGAIDDRQVLPLLESCLAEIKALLFQSGPVCAEERPANAENAAIYEILHEIANKWKRSTDSALKERASPVEDEEQIDPNATVIIPADTKHFNDLKDRKKEEVIPSTSSKVSRASSNSKTMISEDLSVQENVGVTGSTIERDETLIKYPTAGQAQAKEPETKIRSSGYAENSRTKLPIDDLEETIRFGSRTNGSETASQDGVSTAGPADLLLETIVIKKGAQDNKVETSGGQHVVDRAKNEPKESAKSLMVKEDDFLTETVVLKPSGKVVKR